MTGNGRETGLDGAVVLVTGASGDIGGATCDALIAAGARVVATDLSGRRQARSGVTSLEHDVTSPRDWEAVRDEIRNSHGRLDALVNCAGVCLADFIADLKLEQLRLTFAVNVEAAFIGIQTLLDLLREGGASRHGGASIVNLSSLAGIRGAAMASAYCASKGAVTLLTKAAAKEFGLLGYPIRVNSVHPGAVDGSMMDANMARAVASGLSGSLEAAKAATVGSRPLARMAQPSEIADGIAFLCSTKSSYMTGSELVIDGGSSAG